MGAINPGILIRQFKDNLYLATNQGFDPWIIYTQACLETGNFTSDLAQRYNFWGIKAYPGCKFDTYTKDSIEGDGVIDDRGNLVVHKEKSGFVVYPDCYVSMTDYIRIIHQWHPKSWASRDNYEEYFKNIASWSTSKKYTETLTDLYVRLQWEGCFKV